MYIHISNGSVKDIVVLIHAEVTLKLDVKNVVWPHNSHTTWNPKPWT